MTKEFTTEDIRAKYAAAASGYDFCIALLDVLILRKLRKNLLKRARGRVLEVGVGTGANLRYYPLECKITGIDYTSEMLEKARKRAAQLGREAELIRGDAQHLPFKKGSFDTVIDTFCLCTYPDAVKALREMKRVCKQRGQILLLEHGKSSNAFIERLQCWREKPHYRSIGCHLRRDPIELTRKAGLKIIEQKRSLFGIFYVLRAELLNERSGKTFK